jgi:hypothetical protein
MPMTVSDTIEEKLDYALEMTFPASDPFNIHLPEAERDEASASADPRAPTRAHRRRL